ncbi:MAG: DUF6528 family protein [Massilibacteroides sp.]|nr:DUF6528 family protein [Massilibacteroides sp.]MDD3061703.1 DUF6528 family protein [Massilibacteroides sp.]MDD4114334.1 DUF6528 family protein [Massilibacteroides sp.]MDD4660252.1 DUF6528 family protein [Massilibacteroides sp.]
MRQSLFLLISILFTGLSSCTKVPEELIVCGDGKVLIIDPARSNETDVTVKWQWDISEASEIPEIYQKYLFPLDECKPIDQNTKLLITSSGGGVVLLEKETKKILFYANAPMAHSAAILPNDRIVVALSNHPYGDAVEVFDIQTPEKCLYRDTLYSGHGAVWIPEREGLFVLGEFELRSYSLKNWNTENPELKKEKSWLLPAQGGHDLTRISADELLITEAEHVWTFHIDKEFFESFPWVNKADVKSINFNKETQHVVYTKAEINWWTHTVYMKNPDKKINIPGTNLYKVRVYPE